MGKPNNLSSSLGRDPRASAQRRDRALRLRRRVTTAIATTGAGLLAVFGLLAAGHSAGKAAAASTTSTTSASNSTSTPATSFSSSSSTAPLATPATTVARAASASPTPVVVSGGS